MVAGVDDVMQEAARENRGAPPLIGRRGCGGLLSRAFTLDFGLRTAVSCLRVFFYAYLFL